MYGNDIRRGFAMKLTIWPQVAPPIYPPGAIQESILAGNKEVTSLVQVGRIAVKYQPSRSALKSWVSSRACSAKKKTLHSPSGTCRALAEAGALFNDVYQVACNPARPASVENIVQTRSHIRELTEVCKR